MLATCATREATVDCGELYDLTKVAMSTLVGGVDPPSLATLVPATPAWAVRDVLAHVVGITADMNHRRFGLRAEAWTARQVDERRDSDPATMIAEWDREAPAFEDGLRLFGYEMGSHYVADLHAHLQDVRSALDLGRADDDTTVRVALDFYLGSLDGTLREANASAVELVAGGEAHVVGDGEVGATVRADAFELLRVLSARRSRAQIRALDWTGDVDAVLEQLGRYPFPDADLND